MILLGFEIHTLRINPSSREIVSVDLREREISDVLRSLPVSVNYPYSIPRRPDVPALTEEQIAGLTRAVFLDLPAEPAPCDLIFVFGGLKPGLWQTAAKAYHLGLAPRILLTGGIHWRRTDPREREEAESRVMARHLIEAGVPMECIMLEDRSTTSSIENILCAQEVFDFSTIDSILVVYRSYTCRQFRLMQRMMPAHIRLVPYPFDMADSTGHLITRETWMDSPEGRAFVFGEYLRLLAYARCGSIDPLELPVDGIDESILDRYLKQAAG